MPAKKTTVKKSAAKKPVAKAAPVMEHKCECGEHCKCHCHGSAHWVKHIVVWALIFALGMACGKMMPCGQGHKKMQKMHPVFVNGCLDMSSIKYQKLKEKLMNADVNADECISIEEYKAVKKEMAPAKKKQQQGGLAQAIRNHQNRK